MSSLREKGATRHSRSSCPLCRAPLPKSDEPLLEEEEEEDWLWDEMDSFLADDAEMLFNQLFLAAMSLLDEPSGQFAFDAERPEWYEPSHRLGGSAFLDDDDAVDAERRRLDELDRMLLVAGDLATISRRCVRALEALDAVFGLGNRELLLLRVELVRAPPPQPAAPLPARTAPPSPTSVDDLAGFLADAGLASGSFDEVAAPRRGDAPRAAPGRAGVVGAEVRR